MDQRNEPNHEEEQVKISNVAKFQSCNPNTRGMTDIWNPENKRQMYGSKAWLPYIWLLFL